MGVSGQHHAPATLCEHGLETPCSLVLVGGMYRLHLQGKVLLKDMVYSKYSHIEEFIITKMIQHADNS
jgi:hypothetical protein